MPRSDNNTDLLDFERQFQPSDSPPTGMTREMSESSNWSDEMVERARLRVTDVDFITVGGGLGSFVMADMLRISGVPTHKIKVIGVNELPWQNYRHLTRVSQIPEQERLRSDSGSSPDNIWAFPGLALREAWQQRGLGRKLAPLLQVLTEPLLHDYYTPEAGQVFRSLAREADRIAYHSMLHRGQVSVVRKRTAGGFFVLFTPAETPSRTDPTAEIYRCRYVHIAVGYPGLRLLPDLQDFRARYGIGVPFVNAYEPHDHVYAELARRPGTVLVRGSGIAASRVLQRIIDDRELGAQTQVIHLFRTYISRAQGPHLLMRRPGSNGWSYQGFNWPKATWGGQLKRRLERLEGANRKALYDVMGGTTTARRERWMRQLEQGSEQKFYQQVTGVADTVSYGAHGKITVAVKRDDGTTKDTVVDSIIDCTGLEADIREHTVIADLIDYSGAGLNPMGRLDVSRRFEIRGTGNGGRLYASGASTLGAYFAPVDTFLGLQFAALQICDDLASQGFCQRIGVGRSVTGWLRWARNASPAESK